MSTTPDIPKVALSVREPWSWALRFAGKSADGCENRAWKHAPKFRGPMLLHAGVGCTRLEFGQAADFMRRRGLIAAQGGHGDVHALPALDAPWDAHNPQWHLTRGGYVARAELSDVRFNMSNGHQAPISATNRIDTDAICARCNNSTLSGSCRNPDRWAIVGQLAFIIRHVVPFDVIIPGPGQLGLYRVDPIKFREARTLALDMADAGANPTDKANRPAFDDIWGIVRKGDA